MKKYSLGIIQSHATQFDGPLFRRIAKHPNINLEVYFLNQISAPYDPEVGRHSGWDNDISMGYNSKEFPKSYWKRLGFARHIYKENDHDLVIVAGYNSPMRILNAVLGKIHKVPTGLRADSVFTHRNNSWKWRVKDFILPKLFRLYSTGHPTGSQAREVMRYYGFAEKSLFKFPYAVDSDYLLGLLGKVYPLRKVLRRDLGIRPEDFVVLGILKFVPREDPLTLLSAYQMLHKECPGSHLILVGDGELMESIKQMVDREKIPNVHLPGYVNYSRLPEFFAIADSFVHPARVEPWGVTVNEAMICGAVVISADTVGAAKDLIINGETGLVFPAGDARKLKVQLKILCENAELRDSLSKRAKSSIAGWTYENTIGTLLAALKFAQTLK